MVEAGESIDPREVFETDGWICGVCREPVDPALEWPDPRSASVDHIRPIARGGAHVRANVQCTHLACNILKSAS